MDSPVFVLSSVRSGSTLLRVLLNSHSQIRAPHEMHLRTVHVHLSRDFTADAMRALGPRPQGHPRGGPSSATGATPSGRAVSSPPRPPKRRSNSRPGSPSWRGRGGTRPSGGRIPPRRERQPVNPAVMEVNCQLFWLMPEQLLTTPPPGQGRSRLTAQ
ncbi:sulfotransferase [Streptomyces sp. NPDC059697]|uniref:sulfotransferase n=1 Tax=Streptomyces sp. NPDC059697 TaxID=3346912 RepID=UPI00367BD401